MNFGNETPSTRGRALEPQTTPNKQFALRPEEVAMYKDCGRELYFKIGIPFAVFCEMVASYLPKKPGVDKVVPPSLLFRGFRFLGNVILGRFLGTPICYNKLVAMRAEFLKNNPEFESQSMVKPEIPQPVIQSKDLGYPPQAPSLDDLDTFSSDFNTSKLISDDSESVKTSTTTYQELRARHRSGYQGYKGPLSNVQSAPPKPGIDSPPNEKPDFSESSPLSPPSPPQRIVKKTKYGDEME